MCEKWGEDAFWYAGHQQPVWMEAEQQRERSAALCEPCIASCGRLAPLGGIPLPAGLRLGQAMTCAVGFCVPSDEGADYVAACRLWKAAAEVEEAAEDGGEVGNEVDIEEENPDEEEMSISRSGRKLLMQVSTFAMPACDNCPAPFASSV